MRIDAHQHFWQLSNPFCDWPTPAEKKIHADFGPGDLEALLLANAIDGTVLVQAAPSIAETLYLLDIAEQTPFVKGVVGWIDFESVSAVSDLEALAGRPLLRGIRPMLQSISDPAWMLSPAFDGIYKRLAALGLAFDALILPAHLPHLRELAERYPDLSIIVDHGAKPAIRNGMSGFNDWATGMQSLARHANVSCKVSGLLTKAAPGAGLSDLRSWLEHLYVAFGPGRLLWGSDWPVVLMEADYTRWLSICEEWLADKPAVARAQIFGAAACRIYGLVKMVRQDERIHATGDGQHGAH
ncbi:amidohydrolase family protein [Parvibaculum sp.]|jgi:L-fuconolactonase|uniref:amidohydrolase family protein n=1 Tax=Parvibaculum sp. TaxID=2024848 RepID=UPI002FD9AD89